jgi:hypothetical protein
MNAPLPERVISDNDLVRVLPEFAKDVAQDAMTITSDVTNKQVNDAFGASATLSVQIVVQDGRPIGLINRNLFLDVMARPFYRELFARKSCTEFMEPSPLVVEASTPIYDIAELAATAGPSVLRDGFIIVENGKFHGVCDGLSLLRTMSSIQEEQHRQLTSSIEYASTIQGAMHAESRLVLEQAFGEHYSLVWNPRDIVGGDCFYARMIDGQPFVCLFDCTGHGVPGALLTSIVLSEADRLVALAEADRVVGAADVIDPAAFLGALHRRVKTVLGQTEPTREVTDVDDGLDAVVMRFDQKKKTATISSAKLPIFHRDDQGQPHVLKGDKFGIAYGDVPSDNQWTNLHIDLKLGTRLFVATDGLCDQIGGRKAIAYGWNRFHASIKNHAIADVRRQGEQVLKDFVDYQGEQMRRDDITFVGIEISQKWLDAGV